jgi:TPR repeat protein
MARFEMASVEAAMLGEAPASGDVFFELGMKYAVGGAVQADLVSAHKWFNLAAMRGNTEAIRLRREIAEQMTEREISAAQRAARAWLASTH